MTVKELVEKMKALKYGIIVEYLDYGAYLKSDTIKTEKQLDPRYANEEVVSWRIYNKSLFETVLEIEIGKEDKYENKDGKIEKADNG